MCSCLFRGFGCFTIWFLSLKNVYSSFKTQEIAEVFFFIPTNYVKIKVHSTIRCIRSHKAKFCRIVGQKSVKVFFYRHPTYRLFMTAHLSVAYFYKKIPAGYSGEFVQRTSEVNSHWIIHTTIVCLLCSKA